VSADSEAGPQDQPNRSEQRGSAGSGAKPDPVALLRRSSLLGTLDEEDLVRLARRSRLRRYRRGQVLFTEGDPADAVLIVAEGRLKVLVIADDGREHVVNIAEVGDTIGELALADAGPRSATVEALDETVVMVVDRAVVEEMIRERPVVAQKLLRALGAHVRRLTGQNADLVFLDLPRRVAKLLLYRMRQSRHSVIELGLNQTEIAAMLGGSRQSVNQALRDMEKRGWILAEGSTITIQEADRLRRFAGE
jgi:CRP/FNR family cyclic AMP-dependent transcriptional regulator